MICSFRPTASGGPQPFRPFDQDHINPGHRHMSNIDTVIQDLVIANRILAKEEVVDAYVPVWDSADKFGDTNLLVVNMEQGRDLAKCLANNNVALMRGHGFASAGRSLIEVVRMSVYLPRNARALLRAKQLGGEVKYLAQGEIDARNRGYSPYSTETWRAWEYWANKAGCSHIDRKS